MLTASPRFDRPDSAGDDAGPAIHLRTTRPFFGMIECVVVDPPANFEFDGAILREHGNAVWTWFVRELGSEFLDPVETAAARSALAAVAGGDQPKG